MLRNTFFAVIASAALSIAIAVGCSGENADKQDSGAGAETRHGLTKAQAEEVLVKIGDTNITVGEFADRLADQSPYLRARYNSPERRREFLDNLVRFELLAAEARRRGYEKLPEVDRTRKQVMIQQMMKELFEDRIQLSDITDQEIRQYYESHRDEFHKPEQVRASHIQFRDQNKAQRVLREILAHENDVNFFRQMAEQHNEDPETRDRFGDLRFFSRPNQRQEGDPEVPAAVAEAAFAIEQIGGVHREVVRSDRGWHIVKLTGRRAALERTLEEARRPIQNRLWREKRESAVEQFVTNLRRQARVREHWDALRQVRIDIPEGEVPAAPVPAQPVVPAPPPAKAPRR